MFNSFSIFGIGGKGNIFLNALCEVFASHALINCQYWWCAELSVHCKHCGSHYNWLDSLFFFFVTLLLTLQYPVESNIHNFGGSVQNQGHSFSPTGNMQKETPFPAPTHKENNSCLFVTSIKISWLYCLLNL